MVREGRGVGFASSLAIPRAASTDCFRHAARAAFFLLIGNSLCSSLDDVAHHCSSSGLYISCAVDPKAALATMFARTANVSCWPRPCKNASRRPQPGKPTSQIVLRRLADDSGEVKRHPKTEGLRVFTHSRPRLCQNSKLPGFRVSLHPSRSAAKPIRSVLVGRFSCSTLKSHVLTQPRPASARRQGVAIAAGEAVNAKGIKRPTRNARRYRKRTYSKNIRVQLGVAVPTVLHDAGRMRRPFQSKRRKPIEIAGPPVGRMQYSVPPGA